MKVKGNPQRTPCSSSIRFDLLIDLAAHHRKPHALIRSYHSAALSSADLIRRTDLRRSDPQLSAWWVARDSRSRILVSSETVH